jgi:hypothetical protein
MNPARWDGLVSGALCDDDDLIHRWVPGWCEELELQHSRTHENPSNHSTKAFTAYSRNVRCEIGQQCAQYVVCPVCE